MGWKDALKKAGTFVLNSIREKNEAMREELQRYREIYDRYDDDSLLRKYRSTSGMRKIAIGSLLKERGCDISEDE